MKETLPSSYKSLEAIQTRKDALLKDIRKDDQQLRLLWGNLFHKPTMLVSASPSRRISGLMSAGAGVLDGAILAWKLYRKFKKKKK